MLFVDGGHQRGCWWEDLVDEDEDGLVGGQLDALADDVDELADCQVCWYEVLLLVDGSDVTLLDLFADNLEENSVLAVAPWIVEAVGSGGSGSGECLGERARQFPVGKRMFFEILTGIRSRYFWRIRSASALRFSKGCSSLNLDRILVGVGEAVARLRCARMGCCASGWRTGSARLRSDLECCWGYGESYTCR